MLINLVIELGMSGISIYLDYKAVVDGISDNTRTRTEFGTLMDEYYRSRLASLPNFSISFSRIQANYIDYSLARASLLYVSSHDLELIPNCISSI